MAGGRLTGKTLGPDGEWPVSDISLDGHRLTFKVHNGDEYLEADLKRAGEDFEGSWTATSSGERGRLKMRRSK